MNQKVATALFLLGLFGGCAWEGERISTAGDHPALGKPEAMTPAALEDEVDTGRLLVDGPTALRTGYSVYDPEGRHIAHQARQTSGRPEELKLAPGRYFVRLDVPVRAPRDFWVTVEKRKVTRIDDRSLNDAPVDVR